MKPNTTSGLEFPLHPAEESCPYDYWLPWLKNLALEIIKQTHLSLRKGYKYSAEDFWEILIMHSLMDLSLDEASDELNKILWQKENSKRRRKLLPKQFPGTFIRRERKCPNGDQVRKYRQSLPLWILNRLNDVIFDAQLTYALQKGLISHQLDLLVDNTDQWYYGSDRFPKNPLINRSHKGPGTSRRRNYLGLMIKSQGTSLFVGIHLIKKKHSNVPKIMHCIDRLILRGFNVRTVIGDRWFPTYELLSELNPRGIHYIGPYRKWKPIKRLLEDYLKKGTHYIQPYTLKGAPKKCYHLPGIQVWLIFTNRQGRRLRDIRRDYQLRLIDLSEAMKEIMVMMTTKPPPKRKKAQQGWASSICQKYDRRWQIETGFRDINRLGPPSNAHTNARKFTMRSVQYWLYNTWQIERARRRKNKNLLKSWKKGPTLRQFSFVQTQLRLVEQKI
ncbi:transposase [Candidatus Lokiarchaeum ossiferum]|uniref:transposase n=1 Tax=Candidatus Lokiarchaeum ossiferum TaxID=2951803 RepID=UPI00352E1620